MLDLSGNGTERLEACNAHPPPTSYLSTDFLGERNFIAAGNVNYSYLRFGPLSSTSARGGLAGSKQIWQLLKACYLRL